ncbi:MAG: hypothetical protein RMK01_05330 [Thermomicrobium sp.]|nr:hypothetical protein [Thermomicrobium sp.]MDW8059476.1 hypothetical protein [Thermomicrobium sp.]
MTDRVHDPNEWLRFLEAAAQVRFGEARTLALAEELRTMAQSIARILAEPLDFDDEPPADLLSERHSR